MKGDEIIGIASALSLYIAEGKTPEELQFLSAILLQISQTLITLSRERTLLQRSDILINNELTNNKK